MDKIRFALKSWFCLYRSILINTPFHICNVKKERRQGLNCWYLGEVTGAGASPVGDDVAVQTVCSIRALQDGRQLGISHASLLSVGLEEDAAGQWEATHVLFEVRNKICAQLKQ